MRTINYAHRYNHHQSLSHFLDAPRIPSGYHEINYGGLPVHFFADIRGFSSTVVVFCQMINADYEMVPIIVGDGLTRSLSCNRLLISDPSMILSKKLRTGFYIGNSLQPNFQNDLVKIVEKVCPSKVIYFGTSDGGFAALVSALKTPGSYAVVSNPTVNIKLRTNRGDSIRHLLDRGWSSDPTILSSSTPFLWDVVRPFEEVQDTTIFYHQNPRDHTWKKWHYENFRERCNPQNRVIWNLSDVGDGHVFPTNDSLREVLAEFSNSDDANWDHLSSLRLSGYN